MSNCKIFRNKDKSINKVMDEFGNESQLYQDTLFHVSTLVDKIPLTPPIKHYLDKGDIMDTSVSEVALGLWAYSYSKHFRDKYNINKSNLEEVSVDDIIRHIEEYYPKPVTATPTVIQQEVKEGVKELFNSNPELANSVYEAMGFEKVYGRTEELNTSYLYDVKQALGIDNSKSFFKDSIITSTVFHLSKNKIKKFSNDVLGKNTKAPDTVLGHFFSERYYTIASMREQKDDLLLNYRNGESILGHEVHEVSINLKNPYMLNSFIDSLPEYLGINSNLKEIEQYKQARKKLIEEGYDGIVYGLSYDGEGIDYGYVVFNEDDIKIENIKNDKKEVEKNRPSNFNKTLEGGIYKGSYDLTQEQKQQAQQLYSNFLSNFVDNNFDTIIQDLQTKNILDKKCS